MLLVVEDIVANISKDPIQFYSEYNRKLQKYLLDSKSRPRYQSPTKGGLVWEIFENSKFSSERKCLVSLCFFMIGLKEKWRK